MRYKINDQLRIRRFTPEDVEAVHAYASQPIVSQFQSWGPNSETDTKQFLHDALESELETPRRRYVFAVTFPSDVVIGAGELVITDVEHKIAEIGYVLSPDEWGNGYATSIASLLLQFGVEKLELHRITATCDPRNV
ncbi:GNAT family N-acetyltransferase, partial [Exiguobacterium sp.]|uniref:GNAT family N-acetyltransferase n=1 Tax=Exiguobacterium sp. TaxID=44751 RepID=UPI0028ABEDD4